MRRKEYIVPTLYDMKEDLLSDSLAGLTVSISYIDSEIGRYVALDQYSHSCLILVLSLLFCLICKIYLK